MSTPDQERARRQRLKQEQRCVQCAALLQDGDGVLCVEHTEAQRRYTTSPRGRKVARSAQARWRARNLEALRAADAAAKAELHAARKADGVCVACDGPRDNATSRCDANGCRQRHIERCARYRASRRAA